MRETTQAEKDRRRDGIASFSGAVIGVAAGVKAYDAYTENNTDVSTVKAGAVSGGAMIVAAGVTTLLVRKLLGSVWNR